MNGQAAVLPHWDDGDLPALLTLDEIGDQRFASRFADRNWNDRSFGGQVLGQAMAAAAMTVDSERHATMLQLVFLHGSDPDVPTEFVVTTLQEGKRFSSRHVRGMQGARVVSEASASFAVAMTSTSYSVSPPDDWSDPEAISETLPLPHGWLEHSGVLGSYVRDKKPCLDCRVPEMIQQVESLDGTAAYFRFG